MFLELRKKRHSSLKLYAHELHVYRDWIYGLTALFVVFLLFAVVHTIVFLRTQSNTLFGFIPEVTSSIPTISREKFRSAKDVVVSRAQKFEQIKTDRIPAEPSNFQK